jgi:type IV pilus assembly protein PilY1
MAINPFTGGRLPQSFFDTNADGSFNTGDTLNGVPVSGIGLPSSPNSPIFIGDIMQVSLDNGGSATIKTNSTTMSASRVSWREIIRD